MKRMLPLAAALVLAACTNDPDGAGDALPEDAAAPLPTTDEVEAIEAAAEEAAASVTEENADETLEALEAAIENAGDE